MANRRIARAKPEPAAPADPQSSPAAPVEGVLNMDEAIAALKTTRPTFYRWLREGKIKAFKVGRQWRFQRQDIERFLQGLQPRVDLPVSPLPLIRDLETKLAALGKTAEVRESDPISKAVFLMSKLGYYQRASDIHLEPHYDGSRWSATLRNRIDGVLHVVAQIDIRLLPALADRWKNLAALNLAEKRAPQDGRIMVEFDGAKADLRLSSIPATMGDAITIRILCPDALQLDLNDFGYAPEDLKRLTMAIHSAQGVVVCNGPTGCGKTTTVYSCIAVLANAETKCLTIEDPVEFMIPWATQVPVNEQAGMTFARAIRAFLRADLDVAFVGEVRDREVLQLCMQASLTGHLVLTTLHAQDSAGALRRMVEIGAPAFLVGDATRLILSQRLVRRLCRYCSKPARLTTDEEATVADIAVRGGLSLAALPREFRQPVGCPKCGGTGYSGRIVIAETMNISFAIAKALREQASTDELRRLAVSEGMTTMEADGIRKAAAGVTTVREVQRVRSM